ncbi:MAG: cytidylate kinase [Polaribacter sp.]
MNTSTSIPVPIITIDGPSGAGKGAITHLVASQLGWRILDSGALYRILGVVSETSGIDLDELSNSTKLCDKVTQLARELDVEFKFNSHSEEIEPFINGESLAKQIRTDHAGQSASKVAVISSARDALLACQKDFAKMPGLVADGRDMGTIVFTKAPVKIFLTASAECRADRRYKQLINKGVGANMRALLKSIQDRDERDQNRSVAPLVPAVDSLIVDSSLLTINEVYTQVIDYAKKMQPDWFA